jgi:hypothetical protein
MKKYLWASMGIVTLYITSYIIGNFDPTWLVAPSVVLLFLFMAVCITNFFAGLGK